MPREVMFIDRRLGRGGPRTMLQLAGALSYEMRPCMVDHDVMRSESQSDTCQTLAERNAKNSAYFRAYLTILLKR